MLPVTLTGTAGLLFVAGWLCISFMRESAAQRRERAKEVLELRRERAEEIAALKVEIADGKREVATVKADHLSCVLQVNGLIGWLQRSGIEVPETLLRMPHA